MGVSFTCSCSCRSRVLEDDLEATSDSSSPHLKNNMDAVSDNQTTDPKALLKDLSLRVSSETVGINGQETKPHCIEMEFVESLVNLGVHLYKSSHPANVHGSHSSISNSSLSYHSFAATPLTQVLPRLYLGTQEDAEQEEAMSQLGVTHIISIVGGGRYSHLGEKHMYIPLRDNGSSDLIVELERSYDFMVESQKPGNKLFIHCQLGQNRSASFVIGFLMRYRQWCLYQSYKFLKEKRQIIHPHHEYIKQLRDLDLKLNNVYSTPEDFLQVSLCPKGKLNIQHEDFSNMMSIEYKRRQSEAILVEQRRQSEPILTLEDPPDPKKSDPLLKDKNRTSPITAVPLSSLSDLDSVQRSFTISRTSAPIRNIRTSSNRSRNGSDVIRRVHRSLDTV